MSDHIGHQELARLADFIKKSLHGPNIETMTMSELRSESLPFGVRTKYGSHVFRSAISSRIGPKTVYLGSPRIRLSRPSDLHQSIISKAPEELDKVIHLLSTLPFVHIRRQMGNNDVFNPICNLYISVADRKNLRLAYMWANTMFKPSKRPGPEVTMIHIPEEHLLRQQVLAIPEHNINVALGTDYMGEDKKGFLRQSMWRADESGMLGLHAGTKMVTVRDARTQNLMRYGVFLFGLSATGKSTWSCHQLGLNTKLGEETFVTQDDVVFLRDDGGALGTEDNFFVKTDVAPDLQEAMYNALIHSSALMENVLVNSKGYPDFLDESLCGNGRAVIQRRQLKVKSGWGKKKIYTKSINLPPLSELDGLIFAFITRRNTIMPFAQRLTPEQGVLAYLWGESSHSFASEPDKAGESVRTVGTDPFIIGSRAKKVNRFYEIMKKLTETYPGKVHCMQYNTGGVGEIIETTVKDGKKTKNVIRKVQRVPIDLMAAIQRGDLRGTNKYELGKLGTEYISEVADHDISAYNVNKLYSQEQIDGYIEELVKGRKKFTEEIASEGLMPEIIKEAERSFEVSPRKHQFKGMTSTPPRITQEKEILLRKPEFENVVPWSRIPRPPRDKSRY
ncbi:phosphoenolpyruvate carboxykinase (ATP) [bacterium]|nr:phosphoenolpyruvate carboxykinase (ATP) [bacterium]